MAGRKGSLAAHMANGRVSLREAAPLCGISYGTAMKLKAKGHLRTIKVGGTYFVSLTEIERFNTFGNYEAPTPEQVATDHEIEVREKIRLEDEKRGPSNLPKYLQHLVKGRSES